MNRAKKIKKTPPKKAKSAKSRGASNKGLVKMVDTGCAVVPAELLEEAIHHVRHGTSQVTLRIYDRDWKAFCSWCQKHKAKPVPAKAQTVVLYMTQLKRDGKKAATIDLALVAISRAHKLAGHDSPVGSSSVREARKSIRRHIGCAPTKKQALLLEELLLLADAQPDTLRGLRDRALLLVGFFGAFRRAELVSLDISDLVFKKKGMLISLSRSKTDQQGQGRCIAIPKFRRSRPCPVASVKQWIQKLEEVSSAQGPLFRSIDRHENVGERLSDKAVALIIKRVVSRSELNIDPEDVAGHSLRSGLATSAAHKGVPQWLIAKQTGHRSMRVLLGYIQDGRALEDNVITAMKL